MNIVIQKKFGFCAQYLPSLNKVSFSVLDRGIGIKNSLSENPELTLTDDLTALKESLKPGISGKTYPSQINKPTGEWANSGFGLFMTSSICKNGGSFFIASGDSGIYLSQGNEKILNVNIQGSALNLTINLDKKESFRKILTNLHKEIKEFENIKASKSSLDILE